MLGSCFCAVVLSNYIQTYSHLACAIGQGAPSPLFGPYSYYYSPAGIQMCPEVDSG